ncbi:DUF2069 domain-containing protein [Salinisphaera sp. PC39]|uniref:DUF2069 domain-containing protein n=1 Tax=Salinisphaera sp. PC39 TaxID=1304156 RepID=UPI00334275CC
MRPSRHARMAALGALALLIGTIALWNAANPWLAVVFIVPLLPPLPGLWRGRPYTYAWTSLLVLAYLAGLITEFWSNPARGYSGVALFAAAALFVACLAFVRLRSREGA